MIDIIGSAFPGVGAAFLVALDVFLKATVVLGLAYAAHAALGRGRALARSALWDATLIGLALVPVASVALPRLRIAVLPAVETGAAVDSTELPSGSSAARLAVAQTAAVQATATEREPASAWESQIAAGSKSEPAAPERRPGMAWLVTGTYLAVGFLLAIRLGSSLVAVGGLKRRCEPVQDMSWLQALERTRETLNVARPVALVQSDRVSIPMVVGWLAPVIVLPASLARTAADELINMVLLHELAHIRRGDYAWNLVHKLVRLVYWPHPLFWPVGRLLGAVREQACDDLCVHETGSAAAYRAALLEVANALLRRPELSVGLAMARTTNLARRLTWIDSSEGRRDVF